MPTYLNEPNYYSMTDYDGMRDAGNHCFKYALAAYAEPFAASSIMADATGYNTELITVQGEFSQLAAPQVKSENVRIEAIKWAEHNEGLVVRLFEYRGQNGSAVVILPSNTHTVKKVNLLERDGVVIPIVDNQVFIDMRSWEIATLLLEH
jgi:alpha-mannosidase